MAAGSVNDGWVTVGQPDSSGWVTLPPGQKIKQAEKQISKPLDKLGKTIVWAHNHPFEAFMAVMGTPQRGLQAAELGQNPLAAMANPKSEPGMQVALRQPMGTQNVAQAAFGPLSAMRGVGSIIGQAERGPLAGQELPKKIARGVLDTAYDAVNDPVTFAPVGKIARGIGKLVPPLAKGTVAMGEMLERSKFGKTFHPEHEIAGFTDHGRAVILSAMNVAKEKSQKVLQEMESLIARDADAIRKGEASAMAERLGIPGSKNPHDFIAAARKIANSDAARAIAGQLRMIGLLPSRAKRAKQIVGDELAQFYKNPANAEAIKTAQKALQEFIKPKPEGGGPVGELLRGAMHLGNQAFLAVPVPHAFNLLDLSHQRYGVGTTLRGLGNAARVAVGATGGKLGQAIAELESLGAKSQYGKLFPEVGFGGTQLPGRIGGAVNAVTGAVAKGANLAAIPFQRASNAAQHFVLNNLETGLRSAALGAEQKGGKVGVDAARMIHQAFGTDPSNALVKWAGEHGQQFAKFHFQTVIANGARTLANNPGRIVNLVKAQRDMNKQINPSGAQFTPTVPSLSFARFATSPASYMASIGGPISTLYQGYGALSQVQKGKVAEALSQGLGRYVPADQVTYVLYQLATGTKGAGGESPISDILPTLTGGYYSKPKP